VTRAADVVLPVAPAAEKAGTFVSWEGRLRPFDAVLSAPGTLTDVRVLEGIAEEMGSPLGFRTVEQVRERMAETGPWDGTRTSKPDAEGRKHVKPGAGEVVLETWRQMIDDGRGQDGQPKYHATARPARLRANAATLKAAGIMPGGRATISTEDGSATFTSEVADLPDGVVWAPANNGANLRVIRAGHGSVVTLNAASPARVDLREDQHGSDSPTDGTVPPVSRGEGES
jgi:NADH-quinone oxidoreductase subunit G